MALTLLLVYSQIGIAVNKWHIPSLESCLTEKEDSSGRDLGLDYFSFCDAAQSSRCEDIVEEGPDMEALDFHFVDDIGSSSYYSPFEMAEEIEEPVESEFIGRDLNVKSCHEENEV
ncbi:hypothetical protein SLEP1_g10431 [Rubroshorea leprosula]|uniref:Uncharacterized protein n=2 Tax=Rubroshorea leprosula TaxID=152421 RepID=A0AAV5IHI1_9ROSI|nr:hypothetical protein SLEP1_g10431 [Rubroshorea leprosula]